MMMAGFVVMTSGNAAIIPMENSNVTKTQADKKQCQENGGDFQSNHGNCTKKFSCFCGDSGIMGTVPRSFPAN